MDVTVDPSGDNCEVNPTMQMAFHSEEAAYDFYNDYAKRVGFKIRRGTVGRNKKTKELTSRLFLCCKEGLRSDRRRDQMPLNPRAETRCGCYAHMGIRLNRKKSQFEIYTLSLNHNHELVPIRCSYMVGSQRKINLHATQIESADHSEIPLMSASGLLGTATGGREILGFTKVDQKNYLQGRRQRSMAFGEAGSIQEYFKKQSFEHNSFYSAVQFDSEELITNIFWADARMIMDYGIFGDVVSFDTTYKINKEHRPFAIFVGFNHHKETVVFGATLMYDESVESYKWLFRTFLEAMSNKSPKTLLTDQDVAVATAVKEVFPSTFHRLFKWHIMQNVLKHIDNIGRGYSEGGSIKTKIAYLMDNIDSEEEFLRVWNCMVQEHDVCENRWLKMLFDVRQKWAHCYVSYEWSAGMKSTQLGESFNSCLKKCLKADHNIVEFFMCFERVLSDKREAEFRAEFNLIHRSPKIAIKIRMIEQASMIYTRHPFQEFQEEYMQSLELTTQSRCQMDAGNMLYSIGLYNAKHLYHVTRNVAFDRLCCSCRRFETRGIICRHVIKVLRDDINPNELPQEYILKRWTRNARATSMQERQSVSLSGNTKLKETERYRNMCALSKKVVARASQSHNAYMHVMEKMRQILDEVENIFADDMNQLLGPKNTTSTYSLGMRTNDVESSTLNSNTSTNGESSNLNADSGKRMGMGVKRRVDPFQSENQEKSALENAMSEAKKISKKKNLQVSETHQMDRQNVVHTRERPAFQSFRVNIGL